MDASALRPLRPLLAAALVCAAVAATAAAAAPRRGENCVLLWQGRGACADGLTCRQDREEPSAAVCQDALEEGDACNNIDSKYGLAGCAIGLYCEGNECVQAQGIGDACGNDLECGLAGRCGEGSSGPECIEYAAEGEKCLQNSDCATNLGCVGDGDSTTYGECSPKYIEGLSCDMDAACIIGLRCLDGTCQALSDVGGPCEAWFHCADDLLCDSSSEQCTERGGAAPAAPVEDTVDDGDTTRGGVVDNGGGVTNDDDGVGDTDNDDGGGTNVAAIAGGVGGAAGLALLAAAIVACCCCCGKCGGKSPKEKRAEKGADASTPAANRTPVAPQPSGSSNPNDESWCDVMGL